MSKRSRVPSERKRLGIRRDPCLVNMLPAKSPRGIAISVEQGGGYPSIVGRFRVLRVALPFFIGDQHR